MNSFCSDEVCWKFARSIEHSTIDSVSPVQHGHRRPCCTALGVRTTRANTLRQHRRGLLNWFDHSLLSSPQSGIDNKIGALQRRAYGDRNHERLKEQLLPIIRPSTPHKVNAILMPIPKESDEPDFLLSAKQKNASEVDFRPHRRLAMFIERMNQFASVPFTRLTVAF